MLFRSYAGLYGCSILRFLRNLHTVLHSGCTNLHSHQQCTRISFSLCPHHPLLSLVLFTVAILTGTRRYFIVVLISLMVSDVGHFSYTCWLFAWCDQLFVGGGPLVYVTTLCMTVPQSSSKGLVKNESCLLSSHSLSVP